MQEDKFRDTETTTWIGKHILISASISPSLIEQPIVLCNSRPGALVESFFDALDVLAAQSQTQLKLKISEIETSVNSELNQIFSAPNQRRCRKAQSLKFEHECVEDEEKNLSTEFLRTQKTQLIDLQIHFEGFCNVHPVFGFNSAKYDIIEMKSCFLPLFVNERKIELKWIKEANQFVSSKFRDIQSLNILNILGGATRFDSFLKAYKAPETKRCFSI